MPVQQRSFNESATADEMEPSPISNELAALAMKAGFSFQLKAVTERSGNQEKACCMRYGT